MTIRSASRLGSSLGVLMLAIVPAASADYDVTVTFEWNDERTCVASIDVDPETTNIPCKNHLRWCGGSATGAPQVTWTVDQAPANYEWWVEHKPQVAERAHFPGSFEIAGAAATKSADGNLPAILNKGDYRWTYKVVARPDDSLSCDEVDTDPQVVFNGGGGATRLPQWVWPTIAALAALVLIAWFAGRRRGRMA